MYATLRLSKFSIKHYLLTYLLSPPSLRSLRLHFRFITSAKALAPVALLVASRYALPGYGDRRVWVRGPGWPDHCVRL